MLTDFADNPVWARLFVALFLLAIAERLRRRAHYPGLGILVLVPATLLGRDLLSLYLCHDFLFVASDMAIVALYVLWLGRYVPIRAVIAAFLPGLAAILALDVVALSAGWPAYASLVFELLAAIGAFTVLATVIIDIRELFVPQAAPIVRARFPLLVMLAAALFLGMVQDYEHPLVLSVIMPLTYFGHLFVPWAYQSQREKDLDKQIRLRERYLDTLFDFMTQTRVAMEERAPTESVLSYVVRTVAEAVDAPSGTAVLIGADGLLHVKATYGFFPPPYEIPPATKAKVGGVEKYFRARAIPVGETVLGEAVRRNRPIFIQRPAQDDRVRRHVQDKVGYMSSLIVVPLTSGDKAIGAVAVAHRDEEHVFTREDYSHAGVLAEYASLTLENLFNYMEILEKKELEKEITMAADIQRGMLPEAVPQLNGVGLGAFTSAARGVSGDYYDYFVMQRSGRLAVAVCDVAGKGIPASLVMVMIRTTMRVLSSTSMDAATMTAWINRGVAGSVDLGRFATFSMIAYDPQTQTLEYSNAGHLPILLYRSRTGEVETLHGEGLPIGIEASASYETKRSTLDGGDVLVMYTDGIVEAKNEARDEFGWERLEEVVTGHHQDDAQGLVDTIADQVRQFAGGEPQSDDQTIVAMKVGTENTGSG